MYLFHEQVKSQLVKVGWLSQQKTWLLSWAKLADCSLEESQLTAAYFLKLAAPTSSIRFLHWQHFDIQAWDAYHCSNSLRNENMVNDLILTLWKHSGSSGWIAINNFNKRIINQSPSSLRKSSGDCNFWYEIARNYIIQEVIYCHIVYII